MPDQTSTISTSTKATADRPKGWKMTTLGEVAEIIMGQSPSGESYNQSNDGLPFYQGITEFGDKYVDIKTFTNQPTKIIDENTILFSVRAPVGKVNFTKHRACIGRGNGFLN
jgi:type I restriction enzyme S subunit